MGSLEIDQPHQRSVWHRQRPICRPPRSVGRHWAGADFHRLETGSSDHHWWHLSTIHSRMNNSIGRWRSPARCPAIWSTAKNMITLYRLPLSGTLDIGIGTITLRNVPCSFTTQSDDASHQSVTPDKAIQGHPIPPPRFHEAAHRSENRARARRNIHCAPHVPPGEQQANKWKPPNSAVPVDPEICTVQISGFVHDFSVYVIEAAPSVWPWKTCTPGSHLTGVYWFSAAQYLCSAVGRRLHDRHCVEHRQSRAIHAQQAARLHGPPNPHRHLQHLGSSIHWSISAYNPYKDDETFLWLFSLPAILEISLIFELSVIISHSTVCPQFFFLSILVFLRHSRSVSNIKPKKEVFLSLFFSRDICQLCRCIFCTCTITRHLYNNCSFVYAHVVKICFSTNCHGLPSSRRSMLRSVVAVFNFLLSPSKCQWVDFYYFLQVLMWFLFNFNSGSRMEQRQVPQFPWTLFNC